MCLPLFEGGRLRGELSAHRAEYDDAVELYHNTLLHAVQEVGETHVLVEESQFVEKGDLLVRLDEPARKRL